MRVMVAGLLICLTLLGMAGQTAWASPMDLSGFEVFPPEAAGVGVSESGGVVTFQEHTDYQVLYFYNDFYPVGNNVILAFDYSTASGAEDLDDYLAFELGNNYDQVLYEPIGNSGHFSIDLTPYLDSSGQVSIAWGLLSGEPEDKAQAGSSARISNIDVSQVPLPSTVVLLASGCAGLAWMRGRRLSR